MNPMVGSAFLVAHGLVTAAIGAGSLAGGPGVPNPAWLNWWPAPLGRSWLLDALPLGAPGVALGGGLWVAGGVMLIAAGAGVLGLPGLHGAWQTLALVGACLSLVALALYLHPYYALGIALNVAIAAALLHPARALLATTTRAG
jgi:hypothetical protein